MAIALYDLSVANYLQTLGAVIGFLEKGLAHFTTTHVDLDEIVETRLSFDARYLWTLPMFHCNGWCFTWGVTSVAGTHICLRRVEPARIWEMLDTQGVTHYNGAPTVQIGVVNDPRAHRLERPVTVTVAGAPPSPTLLGKLRELNFKPVHVYGLTETYGPHTVCAWHDEWDALPADEQARLAARQGQGYALFDLVRVVECRPLSKQKRWRLVEILERAR